MATPRIPEDRERLARDVAEVFVYGIKSLDDFSEEYQEILKNAYRFSGTRYETGQERPAQRTNDTMDII